MGHFRNLIAAGTLLAGCSFPERTVVPAPPVELRDVTLHLLPLVDEVPLDSTDFALATALGWGSGLPGVSLAITALGVDNAAPWTLTTDNDGRATALGLPVGRYQVEGIRLLSDSEKTAIAGTDAEAVVGVATITVTPTGTSTIEVRLPFSYRRGLMISEWAFAPGHILGLASYNFGGFVELYNNGTEPVFLDGMQIAQPYNMTGSPPDTPWTCALAADYQNDPEGTWATYFVAFPGSGGEYALTPGEAVVVAMDAIDHRGLFVDMIDLSAADFEMAGGPDNPAAPDMVDRSLKANPIHDHGPPWQFISSGVAVLVRPGDTATYAHRSFPITSIPTARLPEADIVDAFSTGSPWVSDTPGWQLCPTYIHPRFDRRRAIVLLDATVNFKYSSTRRVLYVDNTGVPVLQHTRASAADWVRAARTPGTIVP